ncbi:MAG: type VI secretion system baseplate subunit TssF [Pseudomonadota bacterium]
MKDILPFYEAELQRLRASASEFASTYPKIASRLQLGADVAEDPHVERLIQSFALLAARVHKRLDDDFPLFTESLLNVLYPHYLRPFPSCSIAQFNIDQGAGQMSTPTALPRGTLLKSKVVKGVACTFRTAYDLQLAPVRLKAAHYRHTAIAPEGLRLPPTASAMISLQLELASPQFNWSHLGASLRVYLDGEPSQVSWLREVLCHRVVAVLVQTSAHGAWSGPHPQRPSLVGFEDDEALIDYDERSHVAYRLLTEYFAFPEKFNFIDLPLPFNAPSRASKAGAPPDTGHLPRSLTLHFVLSGMRSDSDAARLLETLSERNFALGCTPVVNLFQQNADPIRLTHTTSDYPLVVNSRSAYGFEVYSVDKVYRVKQSPDGESIDELRPFFSLHHEDLIGETAVSGTQLGGYWHVRRDEVIAEASPGYERLLSVVDIDFDPVALQTETLSVMVTATNRNLPNMLPFGAPGGDLIIEGGTVATEIRLLRKPTPSHLFDHGQGNAWRLISHLSLNHLSLSGRGIEGLKEMLHLYDLPRDAINRSQVDGLVSVEFRAATAWMAGKPFASFVRGTEIRLVVNEENFVGIGLGLFTGVLDRFFALYAHINSFTQLTVISSRTQQTLYPCPPRNGELTLV